MASGLAYAIKSTAPCEFCSGVSASSTPTTELPLSSAYPKRITYNASRVQWAPAAAHCVATQLCRPH